MGGTGWRTVMGMVGAAAVPAALLHALAGQDRRALGLSAPPFGPPGLLAAHVIAAAPLGLVVANAVRRASGRLALLTWGAAGLLMAIAVAALGPSAASALDAAGAGFLARAATRSALALALVVLWLVPIAGKAGAPGIAAALLVAVLPPVAFAYRLTETLTAEAASDLETGRLTRSFGSVTGLCEIGSWRSIGGAPPADRRRALDKALDRLRRDIRREAYTGSSAGARLERAFRLIQLDRLEDAETLLRPAAAAGPDAVLLLAAIDRDRGRWADCERAYRRLIGDARVADSERLATAYDGLAGVFRSAGRPGDSAAVSREAARRLPAHAASFLLQAGIHELDAGRPSDALGALSEAVRLDPRLGPRAEPLLRQVRVRTPACLLAPPRLGARLD